MKGSLVFHALFIHTLFYTVAASDAHGSKSARRRTQHWKLRQAHENLINNPLDKPVNNPLDGSPLDPTSSTSVPVVSTSTFTSATTSIVSTRTTGLASSSTISSSPTSAPAPTQTSDPAAEQDIATVTERRVSQIVGGLSGAKSISSWLSTQQSNGQWPDVDYTTGCAARRANWPAQTHWQRLLVMAGGWHGGLTGAEKYVKDATLRTAISLGMGWWFDHDFTNPACLDSGGTASCPCNDADTTLWNTNWFSNIILIPELVSQTCLLLGNQTLTTTEHSNCTNIPARSYGTFDHNINGVGFLTGANTLDVAKIGIDLALLNVNTSLITDAYRRVHNELVVEQAVKADGIRPDGSFGQHAGILYNGNYGKDYANDLLVLELAASGTQYAANEASRDALSTLFDGDAWMAIYNTITGVLHWDFSVLGRFISFPAIDNQATGSLNINLTQVQDLGQQWSSSALIDFAESLSEPADSANAGQLTGNRMFYDNDYMVHRGDDYVTSLKMYSSRTQNTECTNTQNPLGFHLSDGTLYTYLNGDEYEDISAAWDWNLIPGITVDYNATALNCDHTRYTGVESFVGGVSDGSVGIAAMRYTNPYTKALHFQKTWFFLDNDIQHVMIANVSSASGASVRSVLDQKRHSGSIIVDGTDMQRSIMGSASTRAGIQSLWHADVGYTFGAEDRTSLSLRVGNATGNWSTIGTSTQPPETVDLFAAWLTHESLNSSVSYTAFPATSYSSFVDKRRNLEVQTVQNDARVSAVFDQAHNTSMSVFWDSTGGSARFVPSGDDAAPITVTSSAQTAIIYNVATGDVTVSDPSQSSSAVQVTLSLGQGTKPDNWGQGSVKSLSFTLPGQGLAGSSVTQNIQDCD